MNIEQIDEVIEALLFLNGNPMSVAEIIAGLELQKSEVNNSLNRLKAKYSGKSGIHLISYNSKLQFCTNPEYADLIAGVLNPIREKELSKSTLETVAIIAYKQPITRLEIEQIRGVNAEYAVQVLLKHNLIEIVGRKDAVGKPLLFGTTDEFLKKFNIESIANLPDYETLVEKIRVIEGVKDAALYNEFEIPAENAIPDFLEGEQNIQRVDGNT